MEATKFRHELKFSINYGDYLVARSRLRAVASPDENGTGEGRYLVKSLYFDNADDKALREKVDGVSRREKFRLRYYNNDPTFIRMEKKLKVNGLCHKESAAVTREDCERLLRGEYEFLLKSGKAVLQELYAKLCFQQLRPRAVIVYDREAYVYRPGNVRITFDREVSAALTPSDFLEPDAPLYSRGSGIIMEVKYDEFLPAVMADAVGVSCRRAAAFSKYAFGRGA